MQKSILGSDKTVSERRIPTHKLEATQQVVSLEKYKSLKFLEEKLATARLTEEQTEKLYFLIGEVVEDRAGVKFEKDGTIRFVEKKKIPMRVRKKQVENQDV